MAVHFNKYHGLGNDYLIIDPNVQDFEMTVANIRLICDRNFGIGSDGILYGPQFEDNAQIPVLRIFNPDGSEAEKSGNGLRIFAKYLFEKRYVQAKNFTVKTLSGIVDVQVQDETGSLIRVNMGKATFTSDKIPVTGARREVVREPIDIDGTEYLVTCLSLGNPHCVIPMTEVSEKIARTIGPSVENHRIFPRRINMQIARVIDRANIEVRIWERGAGYTLASGSSSCAAAAACHKLDLVDREITVHMPGGSLQIGIGRDGEIHMTGPAEGTFEGCFHRDLELKIRAKPHG
jgi:diaminopimelate epimerase